MQEIIRRFGRHVDTYIGGTAVVQILQKLSHSRGLSASITVDNEPEFIGKALHLWALENKVHLHHIPPGKPMQNAFVERFNGTFRDDCLNQHWFRSFTESGFSSSTGALRTATASTLTPSSEAPPRYLRLDLIQ